MRYFIPAALALLSLGCSDSSAPLNDEAEGVWTARTMNGATLPGTISTNSDSTVRLVRDTLHLKPDGTYRQAVHTAIVKNGVTAYTRVIETTGTFKSAKGAAFMGSTEIVTITQTGGDGPITGFRTSDDLEVNSGGTMLVYKR